MSTRPRPTRGRISFVFLTLVAALATVLWSRREDGVSLTVCAPDTNDSCRVTARSVKPGTVGRVVVPIDAAGCASTRAGLCAALRARPAVAFFRRSSLDPITAKLTFVVRFAKAGTSTVTAELPEGSYAMYLFVPPNLAIGDSDRVGVRLTVRRGQMTRTEPLTPGESSTFLAFGGE